MRIIATRWILLAAPTVTLALSFSWTYDGVNPIKLFGLAIFSGLAVDNLFRNRRVLYGNKLLRLLTSTLSLFLLSLGIPVLFSGSPISQQLYGTTGRNIGFLHYFFLSSIFLSVATCRDRNIYKQFLFLLLPLGIFQSAYSLSQKFDFDPAPWKNPGGWMLGTFGNPNYVSSFLGLSVISSIYAVLQTSNSTKLRCLHLLNIFLGSFVAVNSHSIQGVVLITFGIGSALIYTAFRRNVLFGQVSILVFSAISFMGVMGTLQRGPLSSLLYQNSVSVRGDYWYAGLSMFKSNLFTGVGLDSYGDYYWEYRSLQAIERSGPLSYSNSAHNLFIDLAATGGFFLLLTYVFLQVFVLVLIIKLFKSAKSLPIEFYCLITIWIAFHIQTLVSINIAGLAVWGWITSGLLVAFYIQFKEVTIIDFKVQKLNIVNIMSASILISLLSGLVVPLLNSQAKLASALAKNNYEEISLALNSYPRDGQLLGRTASAYQKLGQQEKSLELARNALRSNSRSLAAWEVIFFDPTTSIQEKSEARRNLKLINPIWKPSS
jgi:O-antigen ligase